MSIIALVPARSGSKGIPNKNIRPLAGRTLLDYVAQAAYASSLIDRVVLSTDCPLIASAGRRAGLEVPFIRPAELAQDSTPMLPVIEHAVDFLTSSGYKAEIIVLLQPTSPLRRPSHITTAVRMLIESGADSVVSVVEVPQHLSPDVLMRIDSKGQLVTFLPGGVSRRQDVRQAFVRDGTVYAFWTKTLRDHRSIYGPDCRAMIVPASESITLDTEADWAAAERRLDATKPL